MAQTGELSVADVRTALNEVDAMTFPDSTVEQKLTEAETIIAHELDKQGDDIDDIDQQVFNIAARGLAVWKVWMSTPQEMRRGALDLNITYDVQTYTNRLRDEKDKALALIGLAEGGASAGIADKTDGAWDKTNYHAHDWEI